MQTVASLLEGPPDFRLEFEPAFQATEAENGLNAKAASATTAEGAHRPLLLCLSHLRWDFVWQRPQHLLSRAAATYRVVVFEEPVFDSDGAPRLDISRRPGGVEIAVPRLSERRSNAENDATLRSLLDVFLCETGDGERVFWYYTPMALTFTRHCRRDLTVFDIMDELSAFRGASPELLTLERELLGRADVVFTGGLSLYEAKRDRHPNVHPFPSSIDVQHFAQARRALLPASAGPSKVSPPHLGFFGVIDERLDLDLIAGVADLRPGWRFTMVGPVVKIDPADLPRRPNIHWAGALSYADLPAELATWNVGLMPFALNEATRFISPTKTPEFLAAGVPVISTAVVDVVRSYGRSGLVDIAGTADEMVSAAERLMESSREPWLTAVDRHLAADSWDRTWLDMARLMGEAFPSMLPATDQVTQAGHRCEPIAPKINTIQIKSLGRL